METNVGEMVQMVVCRLFGHAYEVTHTNRWQVNVPVTVNTLQASPTARMPPSEIQALEGRRKTALRHLAAAWS